MHKETQDNTIIYLNSVVRTLSLTIVIIKSCIQAEFLFTTKAIIFIITKAIANERAPKYRPLFTNLYSL